MTVLGYPSDCAAIGLNNGEPRDKGGPNRVLVFQFLIGMVSLWRRGVNGRV